MLLVTLVLVSLSGAGETFDTKPLVMLVHGSAGRVLAGSVEQRSPSVITLSPGLGLEGLGKDVKGQSKPAGGARLDLMRLCPEPAAYELGFTLTKRPVVVAVAEIRDDHVFRRDAAGGEILDEQTIEGLLLFA